MKKITEPQLDYLRDLFAGFGIKETYLNMEKLNDLSCFEAGIIIQSLRFAKEIQIDVKQVVNATIEHHNTTQTFGGEARC